MGTVLPFMAACASPQTPSFFFTEPSVLNIFWMNIATSDVGKSQSRKKLISQPLEYMMKAKDVVVPDFEVCSFTCAGNSSRHKCFSFKFTMCTYHYCIQIVNLPSVHTTDTGKMINGLMYDKCQ